MRKNLLIVVALLIGGTMPTQSQINNSFRSHFQSFKEQKEQSFRAFRKRINEQFAEKLGREWKEAPVVAPVPQPKYEEVKPVEVPVEEQQPVTLSTPIEFKAVVTPPAPTPQPQPIIPIEKIRLSPMEFDVLVTPLRQGSIEQGNLLQPGQEDVKGSISTIDINAKPLEVDAHRIIFTFFGTKGAVRFDKSHIFHLSSTKEDQITKAWKIMSGDEYCDLLYDCLTIREKRQLCDWAYINMLKDVADAICGKNTDEAVLLQAYLFAQSGYAMRLGRDLSKGHLHLFFGTSHMIYGTWSYDGPKGAGERYYKFGEPLDVRERIAFESVEFPKEKLLSLYIDKEQLLDEDLAQPVVHQAAQCKDMKTSVTPNRNLMQFYDTYPTSMAAGDMMTRWAMYAHTPISAAVREQLYPTIRQAIKGCSQVEAVNKLLNYIQTGYEYRYDNEVWGDDRAFFPDETLYYPYCDCEDRAILLTRMVRDLLGLRCLLVYYPGHLAAAIEFTDEVAKGDYFMVDGHRFTSADPTYIVSRAGQTANAKDKDQAVVIVIN